MLHPMHKQQQYPMTIQLIIELENPSFLLRENALFGVTLELLDGADVLELAGIY